MTDAEQCTEEQRRAMFTLLIDYMAGPRKHTGRILWRATDQPRQRGSDYTATVVAMWLRRPCEMGLLPEDDADAWTPEAIADTLQQFHPRLTVVRHRVSDEHPGTASAELRSPGPCTLLVRLVKKVLDPVRGTVHLVDDLGRSVPAHSFKRIKVLALEMITNTAELVPWPLQDTRRRRRTSKRAQAHSKRVKGET